MELPSISQTRLSSRILSQQRIRIDKKGHPILKKQKFHSITFIDEIQNGKKVHEIYVVECWKELNFNNKKYSNQECCTIF